MSSFGDEAPVLIQTKLHQPHLSQDLVSRPHLIQRLNQGIERKLTLISAQAGAGKSTLLAQWLEQCPQQSAWLMIDEDDNSLTVFATYLCAAIQTIFPNSCEHALDLLNAPVAPPPRIITTAIVNELDALCRRYHASDDAPSAKKNDTDIGLIIALDDYHSIKEPAIHELVAELVLYLPKCVHLALSTRTDPPLPLAGLRARKEMTELRTKDLQFNTEEARKLLELTAGKKLNIDIVQLLRDSTDGWVVGLRLAALSIRDLPEVTDFAERLVGSSSSIIANYLMREVLSQQSSEYQDFLLRSSILNRFNAELCDVVLWFEDDTSPSATGPGVAPAHAILKELRSANLFLLSLDQEERWFRYHHLFRDLLQNRLHRQHDMAFIRTLHVRASRWFEQNGFIEEALSHAFSVGDLDRASRIVARHRYPLMNQARWQRLDRYLGRFPPEFISQQPDLLMLSAWLVYHRGHYEQLPEALGQIEAAIGQSALPPDAIRSLKGEISALVSLLSYYAIDAEQTLAAAEYSLKNTAPELWIVRILARLCLSGAFQMRGKLNRAYQTIFHAADEELVQSNRFKAPTLMTSCYIYWLAADLEGLVQVANQCLELLDYPHADEIKGYVHYHLGCAYLQRNELSTAEEHFQAVVKKPHLVYGECYAHSAFGLSLTHLAQNRPVDARNVTTLAIEYSLETSNSTLLFLSQAFRAEIAIREGQLAAAEQWAGQFDSIPPLSAMLQLYQYQLTFVKIYLARNTPETRRKATELLGQLKHYTESNHNRFFLIEVLALLAILHAAEEDEPAALAQLERALELAQPGGIVRLFVDLGPPLAQLLHTLSTQGVTANYVNQHLVQILQVFGDQTLNQGPLSAHKSQLSAATNVDPLTPREMEVLELLGQRLTNKEIADRLVVSPDTVKTHTLGIYSKLDVHGRRQAVDKARDIGLLPQPRP